MAENPHGTRGELVDERGVTLTAEGRERARQQIAEADARHTPAERERMRRGFLARLDAMAKRYGPWRSTVTLPRQRQ